MASRVFAALTAALFLLVPQGAVRAGEATPEPPPPLGWREPSPVARLFLQLPFEAPEPLPPGPPQAEVEVLYSNNRVFADSNGPVRRCLKQKTAW